MTWDPYWLYDTKQEAIITLVFLHIGFLTMPVLTVISFTKLKLHSKIADIYNGKSGVSLYIPFIACIVINQIFQIVHYIIYGLSVLSGSYRIGCAVRSLNGITVALGRLFLYNYFIVRLYAGFRKSALQYSKRLFIPLGVLYTITLIGSIVVYITWFGFISDCNPDVQIKAVTFAVLQDAFWSVVFTALFVYKLWQLNRLTFPNSDSDTSSHSERYGSAKLTYLVTKLFTVTSVSLLSTWIFLIGLQPIAGAGAYACDISMNSLCLVLSFTKFDPYYRFLCKGCRLICERQCMKKYDDMEMPNVQRCKSMSTMPTMQTSTHPSTELETQHSQSDLNTSNSNINNDTPDFGAV